MLFSIRLEYILFGYLLLAAIVTYIHGRGKELGILWTLFFCLFFTPVVGYLMAYYSPKFKGGEIVVKKETTGSIALTILFICVAVYYLVKLISTAGTPMDSYPSKILYGKEERIGELIGMAFGFVACLGAAAYCSRIKAFRYSGKKPKIDYINTTYLVMAAVLLLLLIIVVIKKFF